jgi:hypothetical protein
MAAGDITCAQLTAAQVLIDNIWADASQKKNYVAKTDAINAVISETTAKLELVKDPDKDRQVKIYWPKNCDETVTDCATGSPNMCDPYGPEGEAECKTYALSKCLETKFSITENKFRTNELSFEQMLAENLLQKMKVMDEQLSQRSVAALNSFSGFNQANGGSAGQYGIGTIGSDGITYIPAANWSMDTIGYLIQNSQMNKFSDPAFIKGSLLFQEFWKAEMNQANAEGKGQAAMANQLRTYTDLFAVDGVNDPDKRIYLMDKGAVAFVSKAWYDKFGTNNPKENMQNWQFSIESKNLPGVKYDVIYANKCVNNDTVHGYMLRLHYDFFLNPTPCTALNTGILTFQCGPVPEG